MRLQIVALVRGLCRGQARVSGEQPAGNDMVGWPVDRLDADQPIARKTEYREAAAFGIAAQDGHIVANGDPSDLQFEVALIAPEPRYLVVGRHPFADNAGRDLPGLVDAILHRFEPHPAASETGRECGAIAYRQNYGFSFPQIIVDDNSFIGREPGIAREFRVGY